MDFLYHIHIMTLFPDVVGDMLCESILGRAQEGHHSCRLPPNSGLYPQQAKASGQLSHGGGHGGSDAGRSSLPVLESYLSGGRRTASHHLPSPAGTVFQQADAKRLQRDYQSLILVCGHYEGIDERFIEECVDEEISFWVILF